MAYDLCVRCNEYFRIDIKAPPCPPICPACCETQIIHIKTINKVNRATKGKHK